MKLIKKKILFITETGSIKHFLSPLFYLMNFSLISQHLGLKCKILKQQGLNIKGF